MNDRNFGARFQRGWHHFTGGEALAFAPPRRAGDLTRSEHQGLLMLSAWPSCGRGGDDGGIGAWLAVLSKHARFRRAVLTKLPALGALARRLDRPPSRTSSPPAGRHDRRPSRWCS